MSDDIWSQKTEYFDDGVKFGTGPEMIAQIKSITRKLEEARGRIGEQDRTISTLREACKFKNDKLEEMDARIAALEAALKLIKDFPITRCQHG